MEEERPTPPRQPRLEHAERLLADHGLAIGPMRVAAGGSGIAVGFPRDPMIHVSWFALGAAVLALAFFRSSRRT